MNDFSRPKPRLGIVSALHEEQAGLIDAMQDRQQQRVGMRNYVSGRLWGLDCICVLSRIGKVAAAATVASLIERFGVTHLVFTGVAGSADTGVRVGDVVVADTLVQHDMDATPLFPRFEIPLTGQSMFASDKRLTDLLVTAAERFFREGTQILPDASYRTDSGSRPPRVHRGLIGSGDEFIHLGKRRAALKEALPALLALEMEGAAVAQVCFEFGVPFAVIRTISDTANEDAPTDFMRFIESVAAPYALGMLQCFIGAAALHDV